MGNIVKTIQAAINELLGIGNQASATILITLFVFFCGLLLQYLFRAYSTSVRKKQKRKSFITAASTFFNRTKSQARNYLEGSEYYQHSNEKNPILKSAHFLPIASKTLFDYKDTYSAFFERPWWRRFLMCNKDLKKHAFIRLWEIMHVVEFMHTDSNKFMDEMSNRYNIFNERRNNSVVTFRRVLEELRLSTEEAKRKNQVISIEFRNYLKELNEIWNSWVDKENTRRPDVTNEKLVLPVIALNEQYNSFGIASRLNDSLYDAKHEYWEQTRHLEAQRNFLVMRSKSFKYYAKLGKHCIILLTSRW